MSKRVEVFVRMEHTQTSCAVCLLFFCTRSLTFVKRYYKSSDVTADNLDLLSDWLLLRDPFI